MDFFEVYQIIPGSQSPVLRASKAPSDRCFTVMSRSRSLDLEAVNATMANVWVASLRDAMYFCHLEQHRTASRATHGESETRKRLTAAIGRGGR